MKIVNILSSHYPGSFTQALCEAFCEELTTAGHEWTTLDLYDRSFNPVMAGDDFNQFFNKEMPAEIRDDQALLAEADCFTFFYPVWWADMPAIMKGWVDRVFAKGFAYDYDEHGARGLLAGKRVVLMCTLGNAKDKMHPGLEGAMRLKEQEGVFGYSGIRHVDHHFYYQVDKSEEIRAEYLARTREIARNL